MNFKTFFWSSLFAVSMGFFESAVVIYLREIAYPGGFSFPIHTLSQNLSATEILREGFSIIMLISVSCLIGKRGIDRFGWFIYNFAIWDIFYYVFLYLLIGWPDSLFTFDLLFLIPVIWTGPVLAPVLLSILMIFLAALIITYSKRIRYLRFRGKELIFLVAGSLICLYSFTIDYIRFSKGKPFSDFTQYQPEKFNWYVFGTGFLLILTGILMFLFFNKKSKKKKESRH